MIKRTAIEYVGQTHYGKCDVCGEWGMLTTRIRSGWFSSVPETEDDCEKCDPYIAEQNKKERHPMNKDEINLADFGVKGDMSSEDDEIIKTAIELLQEQGGGVLRFPVGKFNFYGMESGIYYKGATNDEQS